MDLATVIVFLALYYLRPQEWPIGVSAIRFVLYTMLLGLVSLFFRPRGFKIRDLFRTPHDWVVLAFWLWIVITSPARWETFKDTANLYIFYVVIVQTLYSVPRMNVFVGVWTFLICTIAALALLTLHGFDPLESLPITEGQMKGRLILNLSIFDNPNALGHSLVPAIALLYYFAVWKRPVVIRSVGLALIAMVAYCILLTTSKGAFVAGAATILATLTFGRPKSVQTVIIVVAVVFGGSLLYSLPRMQELNKSKTDEAIQGRIMAFTHGFKVLSPTGIGYRNWYQSFLAGKYHFPRTKFDKESLKKPLPIVSKAPHSSYVCIGAELGYVGFFLHFGILYCCLRTLVTARTATPDEERIRRILFVLIVSYMVSSWIVDFEYRPTFFMFAAATAALHRHLLGLNEEREQKEEPEAQPLLGPPMPSWRARLIPQPAMESAFAQAGAPVAVLSMEPSPIPIREPEPEAAPTKGVAFRWNRVGLIDAAFVLAMTYAALRYWAYLLKHM